LRLFPLGDSLLAPTFWNWRTIMALEKAWIPYRGYWSSPFVRWQGSLGRENSLELAAKSARSFFEQRQIPKDELDGLVLGFTVPQMHSFYGGPWVAALMETPKITGTIVSQACATSARALQSAALEIESGLKDAMLALTCDRTSNGPHIYYPDPGGVGGRGQTEEWVWDNFNADPNTGKPMLATAENVAKEAGISREEQDEITLLRNKQYEDALASDRSFQKGWMLPIEIRLGRKKTKLIEADEGVFPTTAEGLAGLRPVMPEGTVTFGSQTYPADGNAGLLVCNRDKAKAFSKDGSVEIQLLGFGQARVEKAHMPKGVVPAAEAALAMAGIGIKDCAAIKTHNPFAVNDAYFCRKFDLSPEAMNNFGSPLIYGHPQGPTGGRVTVELIEELVQKGGGFGLFSGCAAGDTAMALVLKVSC